MCFEKQDIVVIGTAGVGGYDGVSGNRQNIIIPAHGGSISLYHIAVHILKCAPQLMQKIGPTSKSVLLLWAKWFVFKEKQQLIRFDFQKQVKNIQNNTIQTHYFQVFTYIVNISLKKGKLLKKLLLLKMYFCKA